jgi:hypothetical protein
MVNLHVSCKLNLSILLKKDIPIKSSGTSASGVAFQAYLIEGLARWNLQRSQDSIEGADEKVPRSFDISLKHRLNALSCAVHNKPALEIVQVKCKSLTINRRGVWGFQHGQ